MSGVLWLEAWMREQRYTIKLVHYRNLLTMVDGTFTHRRGDV